MGVAHYIAPYHTRLEPGAWLVLWVSNGEPWLAPVARTTLQAQRRHRDVDEWSTSAPRGLMEGDVSTISPSGWSCAQRRVGRAGVQRCSGISSSGQTGRWCVGSSWASVGRWAPSPSGWGCAQGRVGRGRACRCAAAAAADRRGWCDVQAESPCRAGPGGRTLPPRGLAVIGCGLAEDTDRVTPRQSDRQAVRGCLCCCSCVCSCLFLLRLLVAATTLSLAYFPKRVFLRYTSLGLWLSV